jgi:hypothetical protein
MKIPSLFVFLLFLFIIIVIVFFNQWWSKRQNNAAEGFISFAPEIPNLGSVNIPTYSSTKTVTKLYDNLFYDLTNANIIEVNDAPVNTTAAPTTAAPTETTAAPTETTAAPTTAAPTETTAAPTTAAPTETTAAPTETTAAPTETTAAPTETTAAPTIPAEPFGNIMNAFRSWNKEGLENADPLVPLGQPPNSTKISSIHIKNRDATLHTIFTTLSADGQTVTNTSSTDSQITAISNTFSYWYHLTVTPTTDNYEIIYVTWGMDTFIHVINLTMNPITSVGAFFFANNAVKTNFTFPTVNTSIPITTSGTQYIADSADNTSINQALYGNKSVFQITYFAQFDINNGNLLNITKDASNNQILTVLNRKGQVVDNATAGGLAMDTSATQPFTVMDSTNSFIVFYIPLVAKTIIYVLKKVEGHFEFVNVVRFDVGGVANSDAPSGNPQNLFLSSFINTVYNSNVSNENAVNLGVIAGNLAVNETGGTPYIPITTTPPPHNHHHENDDGKGSVEYIEDGQQSFTELLKTTGSNIVDLLKSTGSGIVDLLKSAGNGVVELTKSTGSGAVDLTKSAGSGAVDLTKSAGSGAVDLAKATEHGVGIENGYNSNNGNYHNQYGQNSNVKPGQGIVDGVDIYSNYGALQSKGTSFIPVTADFSSFA